ncbi:MAG: PH domain-containing protein [Candidatus Liptonbacteria bacterium]|nr:PH domain-containing protein [Candidatus Liptonbacteria bacterium]
MELNKEQRLGHKALILFTLQRSAIPAIIFILSIILLANKTGIANALDKLLGSAKITTAGGAQNVVPILGLGMLVASFLAAAIGALVAWLDYFNYKFALDDYALKIRRGILSKKEIEIPYRQIQDINIDRSLWFRFLGVSRIAILTAGQEEEPEIGEADAQLVILDKAEAESIKEELLKRANVEMVVNAERKMKI